jgi:hypothetical protein
MIAKNLHSDTCDTIECKQKAIMEEKTRKTGTYNIRWLQTFYLVMMHAITLYGLITFNYFENLKTILWCKFAEKNLIQALYVCIL